MSLPNIPKMIAAGEALKAKRRLGQRLGRALFWIVCMAIALIPTLLYVAIAYLAVGWQ